MLTHLERFQMIRSSSFEKMVTSQNGRLFSKNFSNSGGPSGRGLRLHFTQILFENVIQKNKERKRNCQSFYSARKKSRPVWSAPEKILTLLKNGVIIRVFTALYNNIYYIFIQQTCSSLTIATELSNPRAARSLIKS